MRQQVNNGVSYRLEFGCDSFRKTFNDRDVDEEESDCSRGDDIMGVQSVSERGGMVIMINPLRWEVFGTGSGTLLSIEYVFEEPVAGPSRSVGTNCTL